MTDLFLLFGVLPSNDAVVNLKGEKKNKPTVAGNNSRPQIQ